MFSSRAVFEQEPLVLFWKIETPVSQFEGRGVLRFCPDDSMRTVPSTDYPENSDQDTNGLPFLRSSR